MYVVLLWKATENLPRKIFEWKDIKDIEKEMVPKKFHILYNVTSRNTLRCQW